MVDRETVGSRLARLDGELKALEEIHELGRDCFVAPERADLRARAERHLQVAEQICIDVGAHLAAEKGLEPPGTYAGIFDGLARAGIIGEDLGRWLGSAAGQRNVLVHLYQEVDENQVWQTLAELDRFREFAEAARRAAGIGGA